MWHDISQYDIPDRRLLAEGPQSNMGRRKDLGQAKITHTIFGRARVRIIREQDKIRRARLLTALAVGVVGVAAWQGWVVINRTTVPPLSATVRVGAPAFQPEYLPGTGTPLSAGGKQRALPQTEIINPATSQGIAPQQPLGLKTTGQIAAMPAGIQPLPANKPQATPLATSRNSSNNQTGLQQAHKLSATLQPATSLVKTPAAGQQAASSAAAAAPLASPLARKAGSTASPASEMQPPASGNAQNN